MNEFNPALIVVFDYGVELERGDDGNYREREGLISEGLDRVLERATKTPQDFRDLGEGANVGAAPTDRLLESVVAPGERWGDVGGGGGGGGGGGIVESGGGKAPDGGDPGDAAKVLGHVIKRGGGWVWHHLPH